MEAVHNLGHEITIILIAHRLTTVRECDQIFLLDSGPVSYTHLDVYKRQGIRLSRLFR